MPTDISPRIALLDPTEAEGEAVKALASPTGHMALFRLLAHAPDTVLPVMRLGRAILAKQQVDGRLRELAIILALRMVDGRYEYPQHVAIARAEGLSDVSIAAVERLDFTHDFAPDERAVVDFTRQSVEQVRVDDAAYAALAEVLTPREIVELSLSIGYYLMLARLTEAVDLGAEEVQGEAVLAATRASKPG